MASKKATGCLVAALLFVVLGGGTCICGGAAAMSYLPDWLISQVVEDQPSVPKHDAISIERDELVTQIVADLQADGNASISGPELTRLVLDTWPGTTRGGVSIREDMATLDLAISLPGENGQPSPGWVNGHFKAAMTMENGWFTKLQMEAFKVGALDLTPFLDPSSDTQVVINANQQLAQARAGDPDVARVLDAVELATFENGALQLNVSDAGRAMISGPK
jgi:hypothetical protein